MRQVQAIPTKVVGIPNTLLTDDTPIDRLNLTPSSDINIWRFLGPKSLLQIRLLISTIHQIFVRKAGNPENKIENSWALK